MRQKILGMSTKQHRELLAVLLSCDTEILRTYTRRWAPEIQQKLESLSMPGNKDETVALATIHKMRMAHLAMTRAEKSISHAWLAERGMSDGIWPDHSLNFKETEYGN